jgi:hypothetical protein
VSAIYVLAGEERVGPFTIEEIRDRMAEGTYSPETLAWQEGTEEWVPLSSLLAPPNDREIEPTILHESRQCILTTEQLEFAGHVIPLIEMASVEVEAEHTNRRKPITGVVVFTLLLLMLFFIPLHLVATNVLIIRIVGATILGLLLLRCLIPAFAPAQAIVSILLRSGETRMLTLPHAEALTLINAINAAVGPASTAEEDT